MITTTTSSTVTPSTVNVTVASSTTNKVTRKKITKRFSTKNTPEQLIELAKIAESPSSTKEELAKAWKSTKSTTIRKKIASNGNADTDILKMSARLYLKEVLQNPTIELIELFVDDPFIKALKSAYQDPNQFIKVRGHYAFKSSDITILLRACLLSPQLKYETLMKNLLGFLSSDNFRRELQDREVFDRIKNLIGKEFDLSTIKTKQWDLASLHKLGRNNNYYVNHFFTLYKAGIIPEAYIYNLLYKVGANSSSNYSGNSTAINLIIKNIEAGEVEKATKLLLVGNYHTFTTITKKLIASEKDITPHIKTLVKCFESMVEMVVQIGWTGAAKSGEAYIPQCMYNCISNLLIHTCLKTTKKKDMVGLSKEDFIGLYELYKEVGFFKYSSLFLQERVCISDSASLYALNECPHEVIEFVLFNNFLKPKIALSTSVKNITDILDQINDSGVIEDMLYNQSQLDYIKTIRYDCDRMRIKGLIHYGYDLRCYPVYHSRYYYGGRMPQDLLDMWSRGRNDQAHPAITLSPLTKRILNMPQ